MATRPTNDLLVWANTDVNLPNLAGPNKTEPSADIVAKGWDFKQKPSADEFNYILNNLGEHIAYLEGDLTYTFTGDVTGTVNTSGSEDAIINLQVVDNSHNHTSANISDATSLNYANMVMRRDNNGDVAARYFVGDLVGNAATATKWQTARTLTTTGFATGTATGIDGAGNINLELSMGSGFTNSKTTNGYTYLPNGLILQWGWQAGGEDTVYTVTLPITYPNAILNLSTTARSPSVGGGTTDFAAHGDIVSTSTIKVAITSSSGAYPGTNGVFWTTIGY